MTMGRWQATIVDVRGRPQPGASVEVRREITGQPLELLYSDRAGTTPLGNPFTADSEGFAAFHAAGGAFMITATLGSFSRTWRYVGVGLAHESDGLLPLGPWNSIDTYAPGQGVTNQGGTWAAKRTNTNVAPPTLPTTENDDWFLLAGPGQDGAAIAITPTTLTGTTEGALIGHAGQIIEMNNASPNEYVIPANASVAFPVGTIISVTQYGAGETTIQAASGVTLNGVSEGGAAILARYAGITLYKRGTDEWIMQGAHGAVAA